MNKASIKNYAIWARNELISRVSQKVYEYGAEKDNILPYDAQSINGRLLSDDEKRKRQILINEVKHKGYDQVIEEVAYTWFNRFIALRFMEVNNYLPDKVRLFTNENNEFKPQIIDEALHIELAGLDKNKIITLKEANNNEELYKELLLATCNDMSRYLPGMFKPIDDYMTLLFPSNLLREESVLGRLISDIDEDTWTDQVQIIGWLYQYYNTEPKDKTFANLKKNIKINKDTIAPATQLFTPDWIVRYMTENSLGRFWLDGHPKTEIKSNWKYYLDEAEQEESVQIELNKIKEEHAKLRPEDIKFLDPCMGSGHILVYAFDVFMQIYVSEGWTEREAAKSILQNNIYGLDIDERAYQLSYFALMMKARQYNRRILSEGIVPNVMAIEESNTFNKDLLRRFGDLRLLAERVVNTYVDAKEYGSILNVEFTKEELNSLETKLNEIDKMSDYGNLLDQLESDQLYYDFYPLLKQASIMSQKYECVVTNPPYMGGGNMSVLLSSYLKNNYPNSKLDFCTSFLEKSILSTIKYGYTAVIILPVWMFLSSYEKMRDSILIQTQVMNMLHFGRGVFGSDFGSVAFVVLNGHLENYIALYKKLFGAQGSVDTVEEKERRFFLNDQIFLQKQEQYLRIPGKPIAYWASEKMIESFSIGTPLGNVSRPRIGQNTGDNNRFLRLWFEVGYDSITFDLKHSEMLTRKYKWIPYNKGGSYRKWFGNQDYIINWENDGQEVKEFAVVRNKGKHWSRYIQNIENMCKIGVTWTFISSSKFGTRFLPEGFICDVNGSAVFPEPHMALAILALLNSNMSFELLKIENSTMSFQACNIAGIPYSEALSNHVRINELASSCVKIAKEEWDSFEDSWNFKKHPLISSNPYQNKGLRIKKCFDVWSKSCNQRFFEMKKNEEEINFSICSIYNLQGELTTNVPDSEITLRKADLQRDIKSLISYAVGCMFGRYSLDVDGLAYAGGEWDDSKYKSYIPDKDNIIPICDDEYFKDDITGRFIEFIRAAYGEDTLEENLRFIADALGGKGTSREVIRNYFINDFYKDHCNTYRVTGSGKRPIYWQFDSGKKNGFKALVYIHRYTPDLIARMRTSYVHEQQSRYENQISMIQNRIDSAASTSERVKAEKELKKLKEQADELRVYEEKIHHWADKMEPMDLDDGVKANYAKFQELLTKIK